MVATATKVKGTGFAKYLIRVATALSLYLADGSLGARWYGSGTPRLIGVSEGSEITQPGDLERFFSGVAPADPTLRTTNAGHPDRVTTDLVLDAEKRFSALYAVAPHLREDILARWWRAFEEVCPLIEQHTCTRDAAGRLVQGETAFAVHMHETARPTARNDFHPDPALHLHVSVSVVLRADGRLRAPVNSLLFKNQRSIGEAFSKALERHMEPLRTELDRIPDSLIQHFSSRRAELLEVAGGAEATAASRQTAALKTRAGKPTTLTRRELDQAWALAAREHCYHVERPIERAVVRAVPAPELRAAQLSVPSRAEHSTARHSLPSKTPTQDSPLGTLKLFRGSRLLQIFPSGSSRFPVTNRKSPLRPRTYFEQQTLAERLQLALSRRALIDNLTFGLARDGDALETLKRRLAARVAEVRSAMTRNLTSGLVEAFSPDALLRGVRNRRSPLSLTWQEKRQMRIPRERELWEVIERERRVRAAQERSS